MARLREVVRADQLGSAIERNRGSKVTVAQLNCESMDVGPLADIATYAGEVMDVTATVEVKVALAQLGARVCASWIEGNMMFVLLCDGELAFNRLLAQTATMTNKA